MSSKKLNSKKLFYCSFALPELGPGKSDRQRSMRMESYPPIVREAFLSIIIIPKSPYIKDDVQMSK
jgi:hypothetical protein